MKFAATALVAAMAAAASALPSNGTFTTVVVSVYETYCPFATTVVNGEHTYVVSEPGTLTLTDGPYTVTRPIYTTSSVHCEGGCNTPAPVPVPAPTGGYVHSNATVASPVPTKPITPHPGSDSPRKTEPESPIPTPTGGAAKVAGASLAALLGFAVFAL